MGLGDVKGATARENGVILSRSLEDVADGVRFAYTVRPSLGGRIAVMDDVGEAVSMTIDGDPGPEDLALSAGTVTFELPIEAGERKEVALIAHDVAIDDLSIAKPTVERIEVTTEDPERPTGLFGRLGGLLKGVSDQTDQSDADSAATDSRDPLDVAALEALSDDVPASPADVIEDAPAHNTEPPTADGDSASSTGATSDTSVDSGADADEGGSPLENAVEDAVTGTAGSAESASPDAASGDDGLEDAAPRSEDPPRLRESAETDDQDEPIDLSVPAPPADDPDDTTAPSVPDRVDSVLADLVSELAGDDATAHQAALREALGLSGVTAADIDAIRERQIAIRDALEDLRTQARETRQTRTTLEEQVEDVDAGVEAIRDEVSTLHRGCSVLEEEVTGFSDRLAALEDGMAAVDELREEVERAESQREQLTEGITAVDDRIDDLDDEKARLQERLDRLDSTIQDLEAFRQSLTRAFDTGSGSGQGGSRPGSPGSR